MFSLYTVTAVGQVGTTRCMAYQQEANLLATSSWHEINVWDLNTSKNVLSKTVTFDVTCTDINDRFVIVAGTTGVIQLWNLHNCEVVVSGATDDRTGAVSIQLLDGLVICCATRKVVCIVSA